MGGQRREGGHGGGGGEGGGHGGEWGGGRIFSHYTLEFYKAKYAVYKYD